jgi:tRNA (guanine37-N1)-methyltransferase
LIFNILTLFPETFDGYLNTSIVNRAIFKEQIKVEIINIRDFALDKHRQCDDSTYGGGPGMLLKAEPLSVALDSINAKNKRVVFLTPSGKLFNQGYAKELVLEKEIVFICGHYEGIDQRIIDLYVTDEISIGDYILFSGEVGSMVLIDTIARLVKGVIKEESLFEESFEKGLLEYPQYTRPRTFKGLTVPEVLLSGNHAEILKWRKNMSIEKTKKFRPDLL